MNLGEFKTFLSWLAPGEVLTVYPEPGECSRVVVSAGDREWEYFLRPGSLHEHIEEMRVSLQEFRSTTCGR